MYIFQLYTIQHVTIPRKLQKAAKKITNANKRDL